MKKKNYLGLIVLIPYIIFTIITIIQIVQKNDRLVEGKNIEAESVWLTGVPFHQVFEATDLTGVQVWATNEFGVTDGSVVVSLGDEESGEALVEERISCADLPAVAFSDCIELNLDEKFIKGDRLCCVEIYVDGVDGKKIRTYVSRTMSYDVSIEGDSESFIGKQLCYKTIIKRNPSIARTWIIVTAMLIAAVIVFLEIAKGHITTSYMRYQERSILERIIILAVLTIMVLVGIFGGTVSPAPKTKSVDIEDSELENGYMLMEHSSYHQTFTAEDSDIKQINVYLSGYLINNALFVVSLQQGQENVIATVQSDSMTVSDYDYTSYYIMDLSDVELNPGEEYDLFIYTGFMDENQQEPVITKIEYIYG